MRHVVTALAAAGWALAAVTAPAPALTAAEVGALGRAPATGIEGPGTLFEISGRDGDHITADQRVFFGAPDAVFSGYVELGVGTTTISVMIVPVDHSLPWGVDLQFDGGTPQLGRMYAGVADEVRDLPFRLTSVHGDGRGCTATRGTARVDALELGPVADPVHHRSAIRYLDATFTHSCSYNDADRFRGVSTGHLVLNGRATVPSAPQTPAGPATKAPTGAKPKARTAGATVPAAAAPATPTSEVPRTSAPAPGAGGPTGAPPAPSGPTATLTPALSPTATAAVATPSPTLVAEPVRRATGGTVPWWGWAVLAAAVLGTAGGAGLAVRRSG